MSANSHQSFFVYGTLKRGEVRERYWPRRPLVVDLGWTFGRLYDLGAYPGLVPGSDRVRGEIWHFDAADVAALLASLDAVEGFRGAADDLYVRVVAECVTDSGRRVSAFLYRYARIHDLASDLRIGPDERGFCIWRGRGIAPPTSEGDNGMALMPPTTAVAGGRVVLARAPTALNRDSSRW